MTITVFTKKYLQILKEVNFKYTQGKIYKTNYISYQLEIKDDKEIEKALDELAIVLSMVVIKVITKHLFNKHNLKFSNNIKIPKEEIKNDIKKIISDGTINIEGFINFRTKEYKKNIEKQIIKYKKELEIQKDYLEFIKLMRCYVMSQKCKADFLYINLTADNKYELFDAQKKNITEKMINAYKKEYNLKEINYNDCLIDTLFNLLPEKIIIYDLYNTKNIEILNTINLVFFNRIQFANVVDNLNGK